jgi:hypothetical protein
MSLVRRALRAILVATASFTLTLGFGSTADAEPLHVAGALVTAQRREDGIAWHTRWILAPEDVNAFREGDIRFARPLEPGERIELDFGESEVVEAGRVIGLHAEIAALREREIAATVFQPTPKSGTFPLGLPLAAGTAVQIVHVDLGGGAWIDIADAPDLVRHIGYVAPAGVSYGAREEARRLTAYEAKINTHPLYLRGSDLTPSGISGRLTSVQERSRTGYFVTGLAFFVAVGALVVAARKLRGAAMEERADALLAAEIDRSAAKRKHVKEKHA